MKLYLILTVLALAGCTNLAIRDSYAMTPTDRPTIPRAFYGPNRPAGRLATPEDFAKLPCKYIIMPGQRVRYDSRMDYIVLPEHAYAITLAHEADHARKHHAGLPMGEDTAMMAETRELLVNQGWTIAQVRALSANNARATDEMFAEILK